MKVMLFVVVLATAAPVSAEDSAAWSSHRAVADWISTGLVAGQIGADAVMSWRAVDRKHAFGCQALRLGVTIGAAELSKALVHRTRPDGSDQKSFFSEHTALAIASSGWRVSVGIPIAFGAGYGRTAAGKHYLTDVLVGAGVGALAQRLCHG